MKHFYTVHRFFVNGDGEYVDYPIKSFEKREEAEAFCKEYSEFRCCTYSATLYAPHQIVEQTFGADFQECDWYNVKIEKEY